MREPSADGVGRSEEERQSRRMEERKDWAAYLLLVAVVVAISWAMWRLDDRSERLFAVVAAERSRVAGCP